MMTMRKLRFIGLNVVRAFSLITLILVFSSTIFVMVNNIKAVNSFEASRGLNTTMEDCDYIEGSTVPNQAAGVFWAVVASLLIIVQTITLFLSECSWPTPFFDRFFPVLGTNFGLGPLGIFQCLISTQILSHHVDDFTLVSAFFLFAIGCINMFLGLLFRESAKQHRSIRAWRQEAKGILPTTITEKPIFASNTFSRNLQNDSPFNGPRVTIERHDTSVSDAPSWRSTDKVGYGFGRQGEKAAGLRGFMLQKPEESLPRYAAQSQSQSPTKASLSRSASSVSTSSSFYSKDVPREVPPPMPRRYVHDEAGNRESKSDSPSFKSSSQAI